jgi:hypothetical protein
MRGSEAQATVEAWYLLLAWQFSVMTLERAHGTEE